MNNQINKQQDLSNIKHIEENIGKMSIDDGKIAKKFENVIDLKQANETLKQILEDLKEINRDLAQSDENSLRRRINSIGCRNLDSKINWITMLGKDPKPNFPSTVRDLCNLDGPLLNEILDYYNIQSKNDPLMDRRLIAALMSRKQSGLSWIKKQEPKFIREFKERIAYKEQSSVETKKKKLDSDLIIEREEDQPQIVQLKSGDLGEQEYKQLKDQEDIQNSASSFGKIIFKRPKKNTEIENTETSKISSTSEINQIFNLNEKGEEVVEPKQEEKKEIVEEPVKKIYLEQDETKSGLQPPVKKRFIDQNNSKPTSLAPSKVLAREAKAGNLKLLSFYDEEEQESD
ncbi:unnamed protein product [Brachionus calyciflorus]|uniref:DUF4604 domain-containing protein n=1 Tax=Brachionus calyciflorus TaxID=104777 RepID=A0A813N2S3_9BILA|nr:unnamed protein product [Brachionus calyciflorus]